MNINSFGVIFNAASVADSSSVRQNPVTRLSYVPRWRCRKFGLGQQFVEVT